LNYAAPGASFESVAQGFATGLVGTIGVTLIDNLGAVTTVRTTAGIIEQAGLPGVYAAVMTAPATQGQYTIVWDNGAVPLAESDIATDELTVTYSSVATGVTGTEGMTFGEILDAVLLDRFETTHRPRARRAVNNRYAHLWAVEDWTFKYATVNPTTAAGDNTLNGLPDDFGIPVYIWDETGGVELPYLDQRDFYRLYLPALSGTPEAWTVLNETVLLGPTPTAAATWTCYYRRRLTLLDDENDRPQLPPEFHMALVHGGRAELKAHVNDPTRSDDEQLWQLDLDAMRRDYLADVEGQPSEWGADPTFAGYDTLARWS
jgi:hypothetical protein